MINKNLVVELQLIKYLREDLSVTIFVVFKNVCSTGLCLETQIRLCLSHLFQVAEKPCKQPCVVRFEAADHENNAFYYMDGFSISTAFELF